MCGIVGYIGDRNIESILMVGLERLSYRGYDSAGIAILSDGELSHWKQPGKIHELANTIKNLTIEGTVGIGHTRWATHGEPNQINAHPILASNKKIAVVHNGIIENYTALKAQLGQEGHLFRTETDTEVLVHLIERFLDDDLAVAVEKALAQVVGSYAIAVICEEQADRVVIARKGSPLIVGIGDDENYISSDINAVLPHTKNIVYMEDDELAIVKKNELIVKKFGGITITKKVHVVAWDPVAAEKSGYDHYMLKEIFEQPTVVRNIISKFVDKEGQINFKHVQLDNSEMAAPNRLIIQACGTSWHAGLVGKYLLERYTRVLTEVDISSEFRYRQMISQGNEFVMAISQSGETADTLACLREAKSKFFRILSMVNVKNSSIARESDAVIYTHAGQEVGVASTKNFTAQLVCFYLFTIFLGRLKWTITEKQASEMITQLKRIPEYIESILSQADAIKSIAEKYHTAGKFLFIGRGMNYPSALEGALKLKEISYIHATGYPAGELKHGPIALIDEDLPIVCIAPNSDTYDKMFSNIQEVKARKGKTIIVATEGNKDISDYADDVIYIPEVPEELTPILVAVPLQLLSYYIAIALDCDVDQPRNLAKSVTVE